MTREEKIDVVYRHLVKNVVPRGRVTTYGEIGAATGIKSGMHGQPLASVLHHILRLCDERGLPPITSVVVQKDSERDGGRHGVVGQGYFVGEAKTPNKAGRFRSEEFKRVSTGSVYRPDPEAPEPEFRSMIEAHQDSVWAHNDWPEHL